MGALADMVTPGNVVCDVGCDHGYLSIYLVQKKISPNVIAMDVRKGPLSACKEHVEQCGLEQYITMRLSDGLDALEPGETDTVVCAGMGGRLMQQILVRGQEKARVLKELILQPQSELMDFRKFLREQGYRITDENMIEEEGKYYPMMRVVPGEADTEKEETPEEVRVCDRFGRLLLESANPVLYCFLKQREELLKGIRQSITASSRNGAKQRISELEEELEDIRRAYDYY